MYSDTEEKNFWSVKKVFFGIGNLTLLPVGLANQPKTFKLLSKKKFR